MPPSTLWLQMEGWKRERIVVVLGVGPVPDFRGMADLSALVLERRMSAPSEREVLARWLWDRSEVADRLHGPGSWDHIPEAWREEYREYADEALALLRSHTPEGASEADAEPVMWVEEVAGAMLLGVPFFSEAEAVAMAASSEALGYVPARVFALYPREVHPEPIPSNETGEKR